MADRLTIEQRSALMAKIRGAHTKPEKFVRSLLHKLGYRFRVQVKGVPGRPDIAFSKRKKAIFIHGCFWHAHSNCRLHHMPKTRQDFWINKFTKNKERDHRLLLAAEAEGYECLVVWECELGDKALDAKLQEFLGEPRFHGFTRRSKSNFSMAP